MKDNITPLAKKLAEENSIDWHSIKGTGAGGQINERDILMQLGQIMSEEQASESIEAEAIPRTGHIIESMQFIPFLIVAVWVALDQWLKAWVVANIPNINDFSGAIHTIPGFLSLLHTTNKGAAWSLFSGATPVLVVLRFVVGAGILYWVVRQPKLPKIQMVAYSLIVGGAFGNAIDGVLRGEVVDMLWSHWLSAVYGLIRRNEQFPIFNIADMGVVCGVILLLISSFLIPEKPKTPAKLEG
jgi:signal peptidase II